MKLYSIIYLILNAIVDINVLDVSVKLYYFNIIIPSYYVVTQFMLCEAC